jgi:hypothetical protein
LARIAASYAADGRREDVASDISTIKGSDFGGSYVVCGHGFDVLSLYNICIMLRMRIKQESDLFPGLSILMKILVVVCVGICSYLISMMMVMDIIMLMLMLWVVVCKGRPLCRHKSF